MSAPQPSLLELVLKAIVVHTVTYFLVGILALVVFDYGERFADPNFPYPMRLIDDPWVAAGPLFQPIRGLLFALVLYPLRSVVFREKDGWLLIWALLVALGILSTFGPAPGSVEGMIYTTLPLRMHLGALPEVLVQSLLLAVVLWYWVRSSRKRWLTGVMWALFVVALLFAVLGVLLG